jgi:tetratricopeptide (TPR) repeat protein
VGSVVMADRYSYLSYIGLLFVIAYAIDKVWRTNKGALALLKYPLMILVILTGILFSYQTYARTQVWKSSKTLWSDEMNKYPGLRFDHMEKLISKSALFYQNQKKYDLAADNWDCALMLIPDDTSALYNRANMRFQLTEYDSALSDYNKVIESGSRNSSAYKNRALVFVQKKDFSNAEKDFTTAIKLDSGNRGNYFNRGLYYNQTNQDEKALADFNKCLQFNVKNDSIYNWIGVSNHKLKRYDNAIINFSKAIDVNPQSGQYWLNRSFSESALNKKEDAGRDAIKAKQLGFQVDANYLNFLGIK